VPLLVDGEVHGILWLGVRGMPRWSEGDQAFVRAVGRGLTLALERAVQTQRLELQNAELDARTRALEGFANLTRDLTLHDEPYILIKRAQQVVLSLLPAGYALYFERRGEQWILQAQTGELRSEGLQAAVDAGLPYATTNNLVIPFTTVAPYYQDQYARSTDNLDDMVGHIGASATLPVLVNGAPRGIFAVVLFGDERHWTRPDQAALESVVRSLGLALERAESVAHLEARTREVSEWRERYEVAVRGSGHLLYDWDPATDQIVYGGAVEQITGYAPQELTGSLADWTGHLIHPDDRETFTQEIARVIQTEDDFHLAFRVVRRDGSVREVEDDGYFKRDAHGVVTRMAGLVKDVTERRQAERALMHANEELRRSNADLEQFAYVASHDLQAPIRAVTSFAGVIDRRYGPLLDDRGRLYLRQIVEGGEHMKRLVDDLLTFSRVHTQQRAFSVTDSAAVFDRVARRLQAEVQATGTHLSRAELPQVLGDEQQLDQLLQNLVSNGLKYRREGVAPRLHVSAVREGQRWRFAVSDNGIGIEPQYFERVFVIFQRLHGQEEYEGTGIGLAVCKKIVERHGGQMGLESTPGQGSTFSFTLPAVPQKTGQRSARLLQAAEA
jgi:PAS domain S-box-containing protein